MREDRIDVLVHYPLEIRLSVYRWRTESSVYVQRCKDVDNLWALSVTDTDLCVYGSLHLVIDPWPLSFFFLGGPLFEFEFSGFLFGL